MLGMRYKLLLSIPEKLHPRSESEPGEGQIGSGEHKAVCVSLLIPVGNPARPGFFFDCWKSCDQ